MTTLYMFKGDLRPAIQPTLKYDATTVVNLTDAVEVRFQLIEEESNSTVLNEVAGIVDPPESGVVKYEWKAGNTDNLNKEKYKARFQVEFSDGKKQTFPKTDDFYIYFKPKRGI